LDSTQATYFQNRGFAQPKLGLYQKAVTDLSKALSIEKSYKAYLDRALAYSQMKMYTAAMDDFNNSISLQPDNAEALYYRGLVSDFDVAPWHRSGE
jgi:tetratricopeptide (TPR) repeat protein